MKSEVFLLLASIVSTVRSAALIPYNHEIRVNPPQIIIDDRPFRPFSDVGAAAAPVIGDDNVGAAAAPVIRDDNTTKSRISDDTLMADGHPEFAEGFDSLDNHFHGLKEPEGVGKDEDLGNLHPDEVYYADDKLLIIKGGGFNVPYSEPEPENIEEEYYGNHILGNPPNPHDEYNGNVATIVPPPPYKYSLFMPADLLRSGSQTQKTYVGSSNRNHQPTRNRNHQTTRNHQPIPRTPLRYEYPISYEAKHVLIPFWIIYPKPVPYYPQVSFIESNSIVPNEFAIVEDNVMGYPDNVASYAPKPFFVDNPISLAGDTAVNYLEPRPPVNPDAEVIRPKYTRTRL